jgi:hypothetical protein
MSKNDENKLNLEGVVDVKITQHDLVDLAVEKVVDDAREKVEKLRKKHNEFEAKMRKESPLTSLLKEISKNKYKDIIDVISEKYEDIVITYNFSSGNYIYAPRFIMESGALRCDNSIVEGETEEQKEERQIIDAIKNRIGKMVSINVSSEEKEFSATFDYIVDYSDKEIVKKLQEEIVLQKDYLKIGKELREAQTEERDLSYKKDRLKNSLTRKVLESSDKGKEILIQIDNLATHNLLVSNKDFNEDREGLWENIPEQ